jgi:hypothetical protein
MKYINKLSGQNTGLWDVKQMVCIFTVIYSIRITVISEYYIANTHCLVPIHTSAFFTDA